ncbi:MAG: hypothetical protein ABSA64_05320 [Sedimentisphaerales bacterium]
MVINSEKKPTSKCWQKYSTTPSSVKASIPMSLFSRTTDLATSFTEMAENVQNQPFTVVNVEFSE